MDFVKVKVAHVLFNELSDAEVGQLIRYQALTAFREKELTNFEENSIFSNKKFEKISQFLSKNYNISLKKVQEKVLEDVEIVKIKRQKNKEKMRNYRSDKENVTSYITDYVTVTEPVTYPATLPPLARVIKSREDYIRVNNRENIEKEREKERDKEREKERDIVEEESSTPSSAQTSRIDFDFFLKTWNEKVKTPSVQVITEARKNKIRTRLKENKNFRDDFVSCLDKILACKFLQGENDRRWRANFDWVIENQMNYVKIIEGNFDDRSNSSEGGYTFSWDSYRN